MPEQMTIGPTAISSYLDLLKDCLTASIYEESAWRIVGTAAEGPKENNKWTPLTPIRAFLIRQLRSRGFLLLRARRFDPVKRAQGRDWPCFGYTMAGRARLDNLEHCIQDVLHHNVPGDFIETGVCAADPQS